MQDLLSLSGLISWLEKQPKAAEYNYGSSVNCLCAQYFRAMGFPLKMMLFDSWYDTKGNEHPLPPDFDSIARFQPHTFGAALKRARRLNRLNQISSIWPWS